MKVSRKGKVIASLFFAIVILTMAWYSYQLITSKLMRLTELDLFIIKCMDGNDENVPIGTKAIRCSCIHDYFYKKFGDDLYNMDIEISVQDSIGINRCLENYKEKN